MSFFLLLALAFVVLGIMIAAAALLRRRARKAKNRHA